MTTTFADSSASIVIDNPLNSAMILLTPCGLLVIIDFRGELVMKKRLFHSMKILSLIFVISLTFTGCSSTNVITGTIPLPQTFTLGSEGYPDTGHFMINDKVYTFLDKHKVSGRTSLDIKLADIKNDLVVLLPEITNGMEWRISEDVSSEKSVIDFNVSPKNTKAGASNKLQKFVISKISKPGKITFSEYNVNGEFAYQLNLDINN